MWMGWVGDAERNKPELESVRCFALRAGEDGRDVEAKAILLCTYRLVGITDIVVLGGISTSRVQWLEGIARRSARDTGVITAF